MNIEEKEVQAELEELGLIVIKEHETKGPFRIGLEFDLDTPVDYTKLIESNFALKKLTKRRDFFYMEFANYDKEKERLTVLVSTPVSEDIYRNISDDSTLIGTNFPDLCWYHAEGTTSETEHEVETKFRESATMGDLTWYLPSRIIDNYVEIMHTLNQGILLGLMQETICYGPILIEDKLED